MHGSNVPHARIRGSIGPYSCVACLLIAARQYVDEPIVPPPPPAPERQSSVPPPPAPRTATVPPPPPARPLETRYKDAARTLRELYNLIGTIGKLCEVAAGPGNEREICYRITSDLTHLDDSEPEFWAAHEYVLRERAHARAQGYSLGVSETQSKANGGSVGRLYDVLHVRYETLLGVAREVSEMLDTYSWTSAAWRTIHAKLRKVINDAE